MGTNNQVHRVIIFVFLPLMIGGLIYVCFRDDSIIMNNWLNKNQLMDLDKIKIRHEEVPDWLLYNLPDGLWIFSYVSMMLLLWGKKFNNKLMFWVFILPISIILHEFGQLIHFFSGRFDKIDLLFYIFGTTAPFLLIKTHYDEK